MLFIIWYFFKIIFGFGLGLNVQKLAVALVSASFIINGSLIVNMPDKYKFFNLHGKAISELYAVSLAIWDHTILLATRHKRTHPALTPASKAGTRFTYPGGMN